jgi:hypothetical protein
MGNKYLNPNYDPDSDNNNRNINYIKPVNPGLKTGLNKSKQGKDGKCC